MDQYSYRRDGQHQPQQYGAGHRGDVQQYVSPPGWYDSNSRFSESPDWRYQPSNVYQDQQHQHQHQHQHQQQQQQQQRPLSSADLDPTLQISPYALVSTAGPSSMTLAAMTTAEFAHVPATTAPADVDWQWHVQPQPRYLAAPTAPPSTYHHAFSAPKDIAYRGDYGHRSQAVGDSYGHTSARSQAVSPAAHVLPSQMEHGGYFATATDTDSAHSSPYGSGPVARPQSLPSMDSSARMVRVGVALETALGSVGEYPNSLSSSPSQWPRGYSSQYPLQHSSATTTTTTTQSLQPGWTPPPLPPPPPKSALGSSTARHHDVGTLTPPRRASKTPPPRGAGSWDAVKPLIKHLYLDERRPLRDVMQIMETRYGFQATVKMYKTRLTQWGFGKNNTQDEVRRLLAAAKHRRDAEGKGTEFVRNGRVVDIGTYLRRKGVSEHELFEAAPEMIGDALPAHVRCRTPTPPPDER